MKQYRPSDIITFGIYNGEDLRFIYTFDPSYIEYIIKNLDHFTINLDNFKDLHTCQIDKNKLAGSYFNSLSIDNELMPLRTYLKDYTNLLDLHYYNTPEKVNKFTFSEDTISILENKKLKCTNDNSSDGLIMA